MGEPLKVNFKRRNFTMAEWIMNNWAAIVAFFDKLFAIIADIVD